MKKEIDLLELYEAIYRILPGRNLQELMDVCYQVTGIPILITDIMYNVLGIAPDTPTGDPLWDLLLSDRGYGPEQVELMYKDGIIQSVDANTAPYIIDWASQKDAPKVQGIVRINKSTEAFVTMNCIGREITPDMIKAMDIIQNICTLFFETSRTDANRFTTYQKMFFNELINGRIESEKYLNSWLEDFGSNLNPPYILTATKVHEERGQLLLSQIRKSCQSLAVNQLMRIQNDTLYILHCQCEALSDSDPFYKAFLNVTARVRAKTGISDAFTSLLDIRTYRTQAEDALAIGMMLHPDRSVFQYTDYILPAILLPRIKDMPPVNYMPKIIDQIRCYDQIHSTDFLHTLKCYVYNLKSASETAQQLHIHRNTLLYRINKIEEHFMISLKDYNTFLHLMIAFYVLDVTSPDLPG